MRRFVLALLIVLIPDGIALAQQTRVELKILSTPEEIANDLTSVPCRHNERLQAVETLFKKMTAEDASISVQKVAGAENVLVTRPGATQERIVVGAHYDFVDLGCGAIDNWSGIVALAHMYRSVTRFQLQKTIVFVGFGNEEVGLVGSKGMVGGISEVELPQYCAMINLDSFGLGAPVALNNLSSSSMVSLAQEMAALLGMPFEKIEVLAANSDSSSFIARSIPAITLSGINSGWMEILHTIKDQATNVRSESVYLGYRLGLAMLDRIDKSPCQAFREDRPAR